MISPELGLKIVDEAKTWLKVPYRHRGTTKDGCDCTGLLIGVMRALGYMRRYQLRYYPLDWNMHSGSGEYLIQEIGRFADEIPKQEIRPGDVLLFKFGRCQSHSGIYVGTGLFIHCYLNAKQVKYGILVNSEWGKRWTKTYRWDEIRIKDDK